PYQPQAGQKQGEKPQAGNYPNQPQGEKPNQPQAGPQPGPARDILPASAGRRLDELERKVDRLVRALEKDRREGGEPEVPRGMPGTPAPPNAEGVIKKVDDRSGRVEINIGSDDGLIRGHELTIYRVDRRATPVRPRATEYLGRIRILSTN